MQPSIPYTEITSEIDAGALYRVTNKTLYYDTRISQNHNSRPFWTFVV